MEERELTPTGGDGPGLWLLLGCGGLLLAGLCLVPPGVIFLAWQGDDSPEVTPTDPAIDPAIDPATAPVPPPSTPLPGPANPPPPDPGTTSARNVVVRITESNVSGVAVGSTCSFPVTRHDRPDGTFWCRAEVRCGGQLLYGGGTAGYFDCTLYEQPQRHVVGQDFGTSGSDTDAAFRIDTLRAEMEIRDDPRGRLGAFLVRGTVTSVQ